MLCSVSGVGLLLTLIGHGVSFRLFDMSVSARSPWRLAVFAALTGLGWVLLRARQQAPDRHASRPPSGQPQPFDVIGRWWLLISIVLVLIAAGIIGASLRSAPPLYPTADGAVLEIFTLHASHGVQPLGPYSRFGWNHPGPALFYLLAPWHVLAGQHTLGLNVGGLCINLLSLIAIAWVVARHRLVFLAPALGFVLTLYAWRTSALLASVWNPHVIVWPAGALLLLATAVAAGDSLALPLLALAASFVAQTHAGLLPFAVAIAALGVIGWATQWRSRPATHNRRWALITLATLGALWALPLYEEWSRSPGNLTKLLTFFSGDTGLRAPQWRDALGVWSDVITSAFRSGLALPWGAKVDPPAGNALTGAALALLGILTIAAWRARSTAPALACFGALSSAGGIVALLSVSQIRGDITDYSIFWISLVGAMNAAFALALGLEMLSGRWRDGLRAHVAALTIMMGLSVPLLTAAWLGISQLVDARTAASVETSADREIAELADALENALSAADGRRARVRIANPVWGQAAGALLQLYKRGVPVAVDPGLDVMYGRLVARGDEDMTFWVVDRSMAALLVAHDGGCVLTTRGDVVLYSATSTTGCVEVSSIPQ